MSSIPPRPILTPMEEINLSAVLELQMAVREAIFEYADLIDHSNLPRIRKVGLRDVLERASSAFKKSIRQKGAR